MPDRQPRIPGLFEEPKPPRDEPKVWGVAALTRRIKRTLEAGFDAITVRGEITGLRPHSSGHLYLNLKERGAVLPAMMFRSDAMRLRFMPRDGMEVEATGTLTYYDPQGKLQLQMRRMAPAGEGALMVALQALKERLAAEGLFDADRKQSLPRYPSRIGLVTSPSGAAVRDLIQVLGRRWPAASVVLVPVRVQGEGAAIEIAEGVRALNRYGEVDLLIVGRGGGSFEDLYAFNEEPVVRAIAASRLPVVSAVGHETDTTLADLVADVRAPTPSAAAEIVVPDRIEIAGRVRSHHGRLQGTTLRAIQNKRTAVERVANRYGFRRPDLFLGREQQRLDDLSTRLGRAVLDRARVGTVAVERAQHALERHHPRQHLERTRLQLLRVEQRLSLVVPQRVRREQARVAALSRALAALDPTAVLGRGYALVRGPDGTLLRDTGTLGPGAPVLVQFANDRAHARVTSVEAGSPLDPPSEEST